MSDSRLPRQLPPVAAVNRHINPIMQFDPSDLVHSTQNNNNNNNADMFSPLDKSSSRTLKLNANEDDQFLTSPLPHRNPSESSDSSQAQNIDDCNASCAQNSSPSSPQSSYNSSYGSNSGRKLISSSNSSITALVPGGVVTTQNISTVIRPKSNSNSLQFVKIQTPELSKKAVEQIRIAEERNISKEKIKEVEEEWQNNLLNWKSKRRQQFPNLVEHETNDASETGDASGGRKIKTFAEMLEQRAKSGNRLGFNLQRYISADEGEDELEAPRIKQESDYTRERIDSDCEVQSTASSGFNHQESRSPCSSEISQLNKKETESPPYCNDSIFQPEPKDNHSISLVQRPENSHQLNSTLKQEVRYSGMEDRSVNQSRPLFNTEIRSRELSNRSDEDSDISGPEEDEEEEQKHLQRIAFEAKLKAFEKLTKPEQAPSPKPPVFRKPVELKETHSKVPGAPVIAPKSLDNKPTTKLSENLETDTKLECTAKEKLSFPNWSSTLDQAVCQKPQDSIPREAINSPPEKRALPDKPIQPDFSPPQMTHFNHDKIASKITKNPPNLPPPLLETQKKEATPSHKRLSREDKDKTVLSVSGKKRCSSCREELGRGAAAFVVESLSLVYHTNCFRCSVCHMNLSNGFRGVDVRVHAGALHCQNCYSKDGLNYSRV